MRIKVLVSAPDNPATQQFLTSFLINETVAVDAGSLGLYRGPQDQARVAHVFLTHTHADHVCSLPIFVENAHEGKQDSVVIHAHLEALESLHADIFNDRIWPDFIRLSLDHAPFLRFDALEAEQAVDVAGLHITPIPVNHIVPTFGYIVDDGTAAVAFGADSGPTDRLWQLAGQLDHLKAVFLEATFPDHMYELAAASAHLTPRLLREEVAKLPNGVAIIAVHIKPRYRAQVVSELQALGLPHLTIGEGGHEYVF